MNQKLFQDAFMIIRVRLIIWTY